MAPRRGSSTTIDRHQDVRVLSVDDTIETLSRLENRLKNVKEKTKKRVQNVSSLSLTLALVDTSTPQREALVQLFRSVARCFPKLKNLGICSEMEHLPHDERFALPVASLTVLLHPNKGLKKLRELSLDGLRFESNDDEMRILVKAISRHEMLQKCLLFDSSMTTLSTGRSGMEKFVSAMSKKLEKLVINGCKLASPEAEGLWAGSCLVNVCRSTTLRELKIHNVDELKEEHIVMLSQALGTNRSLRKLSLLKSQSVEESLTASQHGNKTNKQKHRHGNNCADCPELECLSSDAGALALANMLKENTVLEELCLTSFDFNEYSALFMGNALEHDNTTLLDLWLMVPTNNGGTSSFPVDDPRIDYYLRLNRAGRNSVVNLIQQQDGPTAALERCSNAERKAWINTLINFKRDVDCSFYLLQNVPSLCDLERLCLLP